VYTIHYNYNYNLKLLQLLLLLLLSQLYNIPAINRLKIIIKDYSETVFIEEALHRLVEVYYKVGLEEEAKAAAAILGYNYNSSEWYAQSYKILNKNYKEPKKNDIKKNEGLIRRTIKKILN